MSMILLCSSKNHWNYFEDFLNYCHFIMSFFWKRKKRTNCLFSKLNLYANKINLQQHFMENLLLLPYIATLKIFYLMFINLAWSVILIYRCFRSCSNWTQIHAQLTFLKEIFCKNSYLENFIDKYFEKFFKKY